MNRLQKSNIVVEIKKEYFKEHLDKVKKLIELWINELSAPLPYSKEQRRGWQVRYSPAAEQNPDNNHMIRKHLKSRTLWRNHTSWEQKLELIFSLINQVRTYADDTLTKQLSHIHRDYTEDYLDTAIWQGFELASGNKHRLVYKMSDSGRGVVLGAYTIETKAATSEECNLIMKEHEELSNEISKLRYMTKLVSEWSEVKILQESMKAIANKTVKSNDILHPCGFCKHLWK